MGWGEPHTAPAGQPGPGQDLPHGVRGRATPPRGRGREGDRYRHALEWLAFWEGPGNTEVRVEACRALGLDPRAHHKFDDGCLRPSERPNGDAPAEEG